MAGPRAPLQIPRNPNPLPMETRIGLNQMESRMLRNGHVRFGGRPAETHPPQGGQGAAGRPYTYVRTTSGFCYTAFITDTFSRKIVGWATRSTMRTDALPLEALEHALIAAKGQAMGNLDGLVHHSDRGSQGGFNWLSQHLDAKGGWRWLPRTGVGRPVTCPQRCVGSGVRIGHCVPRCVPQDVRPLRGRCSVSSGR